MIVADRIEEVRRAMALACARAGRASEAVRLLAVSKLQPESRIEDAYRAGIRDFGENYVQELSRKKAALARLAGIRWHLIGPLQSNKAKQAVQAADFFHALDSEKLLREIGRRARQQRQGRPWPVLIQVKLDDEPGKAGAPPEQLPRLAELAMAEPGVRLEGLMAIPRPAGSSEGMRPAFRRLRGLATTLGLRELSMGMTDDLEVAIEEGATWVRVGRRIFGERERGAG